MSVVVHCDEPGCSLTSTVLVVVDARIAFDLPFGWTRGESLGPYASAAHVDTYCPRCTRRRERRREAA